MLFGNGYSLTFSARQTVTTTIERIELRMDSSIFMQLLILGLVRGSMYALMGVGLSLIFGIMAIVNFAHGELFMLGCYIMYFFTIMMGLPFPVGIVAAGIGLLIVGVLLEKSLISTLRRKAGREWLMDSFVLTIGLMVVFQNLALIIFGAVQRGIPNLIAGQSDIGGVVFIYDHIVILTLALFTVGLLWSFVKNGPILQISMHVSPWRFAPP